MKPDVKIATFLIAIAAIPAWPASEFNEQSAWQGIVSHVGDGDTLTVRPLQGGPTHTVRLEGIDAPEICQAYGKTARDALAARLLGQTVQVTVRRHDDYGRSLARVRVQGHDVGGWMVEQGHAWSYRYRHDPGPYAAVESQARLAQRGLFAQPGAELPRNFRQRYGACN